MSTMATHFPYEILLRIASDLSADDRTTCLYVSKSWKLAFTQVLYHSVSIFSRRQFRLFYRALMETASSSAVGLAVHKLYLSKTVGFSRDEFESLPRLCPHLTLFEFNEKLWKYLRVSDEIRKWESIRYLPTPSLYDRPHLRSFLLDNFNICFTRLKINICKCSHWLELVARMHHLEHLAIEGDLRTCLDDRKQYITLSVLDSLHTGLPHLRYLCLKHINLGGSLPEPITACETLRQLELELDFDLYSACLPYFSCKYTRLEGLLIVKLVDRAPSEEVHDSVISGFLSWIEKLTALKALHMLPGLLWIPEMGQDYDLVSRQDSRGLFREEAIAKLLRKIHAPITDLSVNANVYEYNASAIRLFCATLEAVEVHLTTSNKLDKAIRYLSLCDSLTFLHLNIEDDNDHGFDTIPLDTLLDVCKSLNTLFVRIPDIVIDSDWLTDANHGLEKLMLATESVDSDVFQFLSDRCPRLRRLYCLFANPDELGEIYMEMPNATLETLQIVVPRTPDFYIRLTQTAKFERMMQRKAKYYGESKIDEDCSWSRWYTVANDEPDKQTRLQIVRTPEDDLEAGTMEIQCRSVDHFVVACVKKEVLTIKEDLDNYFSIVNSRFRNNS
ncbi:hypothetical protein EC973_008791 [Apophysomyces ossiformis]|uniref:F-box domain-containing protein n=1 Tax=Apophysomyces ossiformis TaxID=679940 RepID=A0A8H7ETR6_9FUNG|nr:hypothetical protein EC973_008791 [Apophysomyces ossiformis]